MWRPRVCAEHADPQRHGDGKHKSGALSGQSGWTQALAGPDVLALAGEAVPLCLRRGRPRRRRLDPAATAVRWDRRIDDTPVAVWLYPEAYVGGAVSPAKAPRRRRRSKPRCCWTLSFPRRPRSRARQEERATRPIPHAVSALGRYPNALLGKVVHDALAQWRLEDPGLSQWMAGYLTRERLLDPRPRADSDQGPRALGAFSGFDLTRRSGPLPFAGRRCPIAWSSPRKRAGQRAPQRVPPRAGSTP